MHACKRACMYTYVCMHARKYAHTQHSPALTGKSRDLPSDDIMSSPLFLSDSFVSGCIACGSWKLGLAIKLAMSPTHSLGVRQRSGCPVSRAGSNLGLFALFFFSFPSYILFFCWASDRSREAVATLQLVVRKRAEGTTEGQGSGK